jgi:hypothetical protein
MGNTSAKDVGDFQQRVGQAYAVYGFYMAVFIAILMVLVSMYVGYLAVTIQEFDTYDPCVYDTDCPKDKNSFHTNCNRATNTCSVPSEKGEKGKHPKLLLVSLGIVLLAVAIVFFANLWKNIVLQNRSLAIVSGTGAEIGLARSMF